MIFLRTTGWSGRMAKWGQLAVKINTLAPHLDLDECIATPAVKYGNRNARWIARFVLGAGLLVLLIFSRSVPAQNTPAESQKITPELRKFIDYMVRMHGFEARDLRILFEHTHRNQDVVRAISAPTTSRPWHQFKPLCIDGAQIADGLRFWNENAALLSRARRDFGVPEAIIVALIGIESRYGTHAGGYRVIDSLYTLSFEGPKRANYFRGELEQFLVLAREQSWDPGEVQGSFAGALGWPQFMPSSYRRFAIDYSGDGNIDLWTNMADIIGSVASYLREFGWKEGQPVATPARIDTTDPQAMVELGLKPQLSVAQWRERGVRSPPGTAESLLAGLFSLQVADGLEYWFGFDNFYVLLRYNRSRNYAMAVFQLADEIGQAREKFTVVGFD